MSQPQMFIVAGVNGAGKSTYTRHIAQKFPALNIIDPDAVAKNITGSFSTINTVALAAGKAAIKQVQTGIAKKQAFVIETTLSGGTYLKYLRQAKAENFKIILIYIGLSSPALSAERVSKRVSHGGHNIPLEDIQRRYPKSLANIKRHIELTDLACIYDNSDDSGYQYVASYHKGQLNRAEMVPNYLQEYIPVAFEI